ncbi:hypothetical protein V8J88_23245 [Massilia sp. W12]|uniref:hypothetical protein n=1 Tax=Massilia sp. W12 TaxID=3126507 RepID=UPI0030CCE34B
MKAFKYAPLCLALGSTMAQAALNPLPAAPDTLSFVMSVSNRAGFPSQPMGLLTLQQQGADTRWTLTANWASQYDVSNPFVMSLGFALRDGALHQSSLPLQNLAGQVGLKSFDQSGVFFTSANSSARFTNGEQVSWVFNNTRLDQFLIKDLHINSLYNGQSVKFTPSATPDAPVWAALLGGLGLLGLRRRRKNAAQTLQA